MVDPNEPHFTGTRTTGGQPDDPRWKPGDGRTSRTGGPVGRGSNSGKWIGIAIGALILLALIWWLFGSANVSNDETISPTAGETTITEPTVEGEASTDNPAAAPANETAVPSAPAN